MKLLKNIFVGLSLVAALGSAQTPSSGTAPDNTKVKKRVQNANAKTADQQQTNAADQNPPAPFGKQLLPISHFPRTRRTSRSSRLMAWSH